MHDSEEDDGDGFVNDSESSLAMNYVSIVYVEYFRTDSSIRHRVVTYRSILLFILWWVIRCFTVSSLLVDDREMICSQKYMPNHKI